LDFGYKITTINAPLVLFITNVKKNITVLALNHCLYTDFQLIKKCRFFIYFKN